MATECSMKSLLPARIRRKLLIGWWPPYRGFSCGSAGKESACNAGDLDSTPGLERFPGEGKGYPLQYSGLENSMDCIIHRVAQSSVQFSSVAQSCPTLCDPIDYTVHGVLQARILEWVAFPFSREIFPTQGSSPGLPHWGCILNQLSHKGSPE